MLADIRATQQELSRAKKKLNDLYSARELDTSKILTQEDEVESLERGVERSKDLHGKLFPKSGE